MRCLRSRCLVAVAGALALAGCRNPTEVTVELWTDSCRDAGYTGTAVTALYTTTLADPGTAAANIPPAVQTGRTCGVDGGIGSLVVVPGSKGNGPFVVTVVTGIGRTDPGSCGAGGPGCIVERRQLSLIDNDPVVLPIEMYGVCAGVDCGDGGTCVPVSVCTDAGSCVNKGECTSDIVLTGANQVATLSPDAAVTPPLSDAGHPHDAGSDTGHTEHDAGNAHDAGSDVGTSGELDSGTHDSGHDAEDATLRDGGHDATVVGVPDASEDAPRAIAVLASGQLLPGAIAVHGGHVFWVTDWLPCANSGDAGCAAGGEVLRMSVSGGVPTTLATNQRGPWALVVSDTQVFWTNQGVAPEFNYDAGLDGAAPSEKRPGKRSCVNGLTTAGDADCTGEVRCVGIDGGAAQTIALAQGGPLGLALFGTTLYWVDNFTWNDPYPADASIVPPSGFVMSHSVEPGGTAQPLFGQQAFPGGIVASDTNVYWTNFGLEPASGTVMAGAATGVPAHATAIATGQVFISNIALTGSTIVWVTQNASYVPPGKSNAVAVGGMVLRAPAAGGTAVTLATDGGTIQNVAVDDRNVYWADMTYGTVLRVSLDGGAIVTLAKGLSQPTNVAIDDASVYWTTRGDGGGDAGPTGAVMKISPK